MGDLRDSNGRHWQITIGSAEAICDGENVSNEHSFEIDARPNRLWVDGQLAHTVKVGDDWWIHLDGHIHVLTIDEQGTGGTTDAGGMTAPMPGKVLATEVSPGESVSEGQLLVILEAMKMEHRITAPIDGVVQEVPVN